MVCGEKIEKILKWLDECYETSDDLDIEEGKSYSKLAILELSGWVEESMYDLISDLADKELDGSNAKKRVTEAISNMNGFTYEKHFSKMLLKGIGIVNKEIVERRVRDRNEEKFMKFRNALDDLSERRNHLAHTFSQGRQERIASTSMARNYYNNIFPVLKAFEEEIHKNRYI